jgi:hypothetical protein
MNCPLCGGRMYVRRTRPPRPLETRRTYECPHCQVRGKTIELPLTKYQRLMKELEELRLGRRTLVRMVNRETQKKDTPSPSGEKTGHP